MLNLLEMITFNNILKKIQQMARETGHLNNRNRCCACIDCSDCAYTLILGGCRDASTRNTIIYLDTKIQERKNAKATRN